MATSKGSRSRESSRRKEDQGNEHPKGKKDTVAKDNRKRILMGALAMFVVLILIASFAYLYILSTIPLKQPRIDPVDMLGTKPTKDADSLTSVKITLRNLGEGKMDLEDLSIHWKGPSVETDLMINPLDHTLANKEGFAVGGSGSIEDGWDPASGRFEVMDGTYVWIIINLSASGGIGDPLSPGSNMDLKFSLQNYKGGAVEASFQAPDDFGSGTLVALKMLG